MRDPVVLVIDDDEFYRTALSRAFDEEGCRCYTAADGRQGFKLYGTIIPDLVVLDRIMPEYGGTRFLLAVNDRPNRRDSILVVYSSTIKEERPDEGREQHQKGFSRILYVSKSTNPVELVRRVKDLISC
ncbi:MAG: response regulator [bacterium]|nr:MAG: response regulator [bacterium]